MSPEQLGKQTFAEADVQCFNLFYYDLVVLDSLGLWLFLFKGEKYEHQQLAYHTTQLKV